MFEVSKDFQFLVFIYICISAAIWYYKPNVMFKDNKIKPFGVGKNRTIFSYPIVLIIMSIIMFYIFQLIMLKRTNFL
jgi:hypothetical protein